MAQDLRDLGSEFFHEEQKHADTFSRYVEQFAHQKEIPLAELSSILPVFKPQSCLARLMKLNSKLGGRAVWWLVMLTEEESLSVFSTLKQHQPKIEPLYFNLHRLHYEEEIRHMGYAPLMLRFFQGVHSKSAFSRFLQKFDFIQMYVTHALWITGQLFRLSTLKKYSGNNYFMNHLKSVYIKSRRIPILKLLKLMYTELPWFRDLMFPIKHQSIRSELNRSGTFNSILSKKLHSQWVRSISKEQQA